MAKLGLADVIITGLTYAFLLMFVFFAALNEGDGESTRESEKD